jgi:hypothetical protein
VPRLRPIRAGDVDTSGDTALDDGARDRASFVPVEVGIREIGSRPGGTEGVRFAPVAAQAPTPLS